MYHLCMLIFALLITGANLPAGSADAQTADTTSDVEKLVFEFTAAGENDGHDGDTNEGIVTKLNGEVVDFYGHDGDEAVDENNTSTSSRTFFPMKIANQIAKMKRPVYKVTSLTEGATLKFWDFRWDGLIVDGDTEGAINGATLKDGIFTYYNIKGTDVNKKDYILGETEIGIDLSAEYEDGETPEPPAWNGDTFLGFGLDFGASATIEIYDTAEEEIEPLEPSFRPAVISTVAPLPEQSNIPAGVPGSNVTPEQSSVPSVSKKVKVSGRKYNSQRLTFRVKGKKKGNTVIYVIIGEKSRKIKVICL